MNGAVMRLLALGALAAFSVAAQQAGESSQASQATSTQASTQPQEQTEQQNKAPRRYSIWWPLVPDPLPPLEPPPPETIRLERGTQLNVVLDTPLSTRMTKQGEHVTFLLSEPLDVGDGLELPPDTRILGTVTEAKRPGAFGRAGKLKVKIEKIELPTGGNARLTAKLQSGDPAAAPLKADSNRAVDLYNLASWGLQGTLIGASLGGGKGAAIGAGAGAAAAILIMAARRGPDLYLEPGMPFIVTLDSAVELRGWDVQNAQKQYASANGSGADGSGETASDSNPANDSELRSNRPKLKRRPKTP
jgi:hypothetical protein